MKPIIEELLSNALRSLQELGYAPKKLNMEIKVWRSLDESHGDYSTNLAIILAKSCGQSPLKIADLLITNISKKPQFLRVEIARPGFINFFLDSQGKAQIIATIFKEAENFGKSKLDVTLYYMIDNPEQYTDYDLAKFKDSDNPVFYIKYAHARICSVLRQLQEENLSTNDDLGLLNLDLLKEPLELSLVSILSRYPEVVEMAINKRESCILAYYLRELANTLHNYYNAVQLLCEYNELRAARICLLKAVRQVLQIGLKLMGVSAPESM